MASKNINVLMSLQDKFSSKLKTIGNTTKTTERQIKTAKNSFESFGRGVNNSFKSVMGMAGKLALSVGTLGGVLSTVGLKQYASECMELANKQVQAETKLQTILGNVKTVASGGPEAIQKATKSLTAYAGTLQNVGVIGDEVTLAGMAQLATFQMNESQIKAVSGGMLDLLANTKGLNATQEDAMNIANLMGKVMQGNVGALTRVGITLDEHQKQVLKAGSADEKAAMLAEVLKQNVGGVNEALAKTDAGKAQQALNAYGDFMEDIGKKILPFKATFLGAFKDMLPALKGSLMPLIDRIGASFTECIPAIKEFANSFTAKLPSIIDTVGTGLSILGNAIKFVVDNMDTLIPVLAGVVAGFTAFNVITTAKKALDWFTISAGGAKGVMASLNAVMVANPIAMIALAIGALVAVLIYAYNHCETFRTFVNNLWEKLKELGSGIASVVGPMITSAIDTISATFTRWRDMLAPAVANIWSALQTFGSWISAVFGPIFDVVLAGVSGAFSAWWSSLCTICDGVMTALDGVVQFVSGVFTGNWSQAWEGVKNIFKGVFDALVGIAMGPLNTIGGFVSGLTNKIGNMLSNLKNGETMAGNPVGGGHALGTSYFKGGLTHVNEGHRGELINLPSGAQIIPHDLSNRLLSGGAKPNVTINFSVAGNVIGNEDFYNECGRAITDRLTTALANV